MSDVVSTRRQQQVLVSDSLDLEGVIDEILSWLPVKSLLRFRCVCKAWRALISDPYFIKKHISCINPNITTSYSLLIREELFRSAKCEAVLECLSHDRPLSKTRLEFSVTDPLFEVCFTVVVGSCNGLICLLLDFENPDICTFVLCTFVLWNPCTGKSQVLPLPPVYFSDRAFYGFGYDSTTNDYKVILGSSEAGHEFVAVFSLKMGSWRQLERLNSYFGVSSVGCLVSGALHWLLKEVEDDRFRPPTMVSFDLAEEKFHESPFPYPPNLVDRPGLIVDVGVLNNCLTLYYPTNCCEPGCNFKMWMLKEYGVKESWTEVINIPSEVLDQETKEYMYMTCISKNGEVLMQSVGDGSLALYNPKEKIFRKIMDSAGYWYDTCTYIETLVSPVTGSIGTGV